MLLALGSPGGKAKSEILYLLSGLFRHLGERGEQGFRLRGMGTDGMSALPISSKGAELM